MSKQLLAIVRVWLRATRSVVAKTHLRAANAAEVGEAVAGYRAVARRAGETDVTPGLDAKIPQGDQSGPSESVRLKNEASPHAYSPFGSICGVIQDGWQSGQMRRVANPLGGLWAAPMVRIHHRPFVEWFTG